jgi:ubiquinone/menaquinone biosynthesis C-methylase UbiE
MKLFPSLEKKYEHEQLSAIEAQRLAQEIAFGPIVFQVSRLMVKFGIFELLSENTGGSTLEDISAKTQLSKYAVQVLLESSLTIGTVLTKDDRFYLSKTGWFLLNDEMVRVNMNFNHDVNYLGLFDLEQTLLTGKPKGLSVFGDWPTIYEGLSQLPENVRNSWFEFDHYYSDGAFEQALEIVFASNPKTLLDVGGNTGRWALQCVNHNDDVEVSVMDLPQQLELMKASIKGKKGADRIYEYRANLLDEQVPFPKGFDAIWMSQFLDCFSEKEVESILKRAVRSMSNNTTLYIMETLWDRQQFETAAYCLTQISIYFSAMANGNSKMYHSDDMIRCVNKAGLRVEKIYDGLGMGHSMLACKSI